MQLELMRASLTDMNKSTNSLNTTNVAGTDVQIAIAFLFVLYSTFNRSRGTCVNLVIITQKLYHHVQ